METFLGELHMTIVNPELGESSVVLPRVAPKEMLSHRVLPNGKTYTKVNSSSLGLSQECLRKAQYVIGEGWRSNAESPATLFGSAIHKALEIYYRGDREDRVLPRMEHLEMMAYGHKPPPTNNDLIYRAVQGFIDVAQPLSLLPAGDKRSIPNGIWILGDYFKTYQDDPYVAYVDKDGPFIERKFTYRLHEDPQQIIDVFGTIDFVFRNVITGELIAGDHKTSSSLSFGDSSYFDRDRPNHQYTTYMLGAKRVFGLDVENFMVNVIQVKPKPKTARGSGASFPRQLTKRTEEDFEELKEVYLKAAFDWRIAVETGVYPMGGVDACNKYGGCQFKQVCASPKAMRETILRNKFIREERP
jgi:hypothetical protein